MPVTLGGGIGTMGLTNPYPDNSNSNSDKMFLIFLQKNRNLWPENAQEAAIKYVDSTVIWVRSKTAIPWN
jgi:hypothetical protein